MLSTVSNISIAAQHLQQQVGAIKDFKALVESAKLHEQDGYELQVVRQDSLAAVVAYFAKKFDCTLGENKQKNAGKLYFVDPVFQNLCSRDEFQVELNSAGEKLEMLIPQNIAEFADQKTAISVPKDLSVAQQKLLAAMLNQATMISEKQLISDLVDHVNKLIPQLKQFGERICFFVPHREKSSSYITYLARTQTNLVTVDSIYDRRKDIPDCDTLVILDDLSCTGRQARNFLQSLSEELEMRPIKIVFAPIYLTNKAAHELDLEDFCVIAHREIPEIDLDRIAAEAEIPRQQISNIYQDSTLILLPHMCPDNNVPNFSRYLAPQFCLTSAGVKQAGEI